MQSFNSFLLFPNSVGVEQTLGGMFMRAVAGVDHARTQTLGQELGRAGAAMAQDNDIDMIRFQNLSGVLQSLAFAQARSGGRNVDHVRAQSKGSQLERSASACTRFDKKINKRSPAQRWYFFDFPCPHLFEGISGVEDEIDFIDRQLAQPEQIFAVPARRRHNQVTRARPSGSTRGTRALPESPTRYQPSNSYALILSPTKRLRRIPFRPNAAGLFRPVQSVNFSQRNPPE